MFALCHKGMLDCMEETLSAAALNQAVVSRILREDSWIREIREKPPRCLPGEVGANAFPITLGALSEGGIPRAAAVFVVLSCGAGLGIGKGALGKAAFCEVASGEATPGRASPATAISGGAAFCARTTELHATVSKITARALLRK
ncbi:MAG: hypothetical protein ACLQVN_07870 [Bryobacteraceae bacterium]